MADVQTTLEERLSAAFATVAGGPADPVLRRSDRADFQANGALALAKVLGRPPQEVAREVAAALEPDGVTASVEVSGPGFLNLTVAPAFLVARLVDLAGDRALGVAPDPAPRRTVVDYSAPNVAKELHVGHLRSTVIGDALCRLLAAVGHDVVRENHLGDWGTPFGMLIEHLVDVGQGGDVHHLSVEDLDEFYRQARSSFDSDPAFAERSRARVVLLQSGDPATLGLWRTLVDESVRHMQEVYATLGVLLTEDDVVGESFYNPLLPAVVDDLAAQGLLVESDGARCVFPPGFTNREGDPLPLIVQKSDGGYGYAATDLAAIRDRVTRVGARRLLYVVGAPQAQHLAMCFAVAAMAGWLPEEAEAEHVSFGQILGPDRKRFASRSGGTITLSSLLDEAVARAEAALRARDPDRDPAETARLARAVGIGAVRWADLASERQRDYVFDWDRMLAFEGDTGPYVQYAQARIRSIFRRAAQEGAGGDWAAAGPPDLSEGPARDLALVLEAYGAAVAAAVADLAPSRLTTYLYELATAFTTFYEHCPVLRAGDPATVAQRLWLSDLVARVLSAGLGLLGIEAPERM
jgi:arginyl-tRNA synthetase